MKSRIMIVATFISFVGWGQSAKEIIKKVDDKMQGNC
jgi:hypothetical protein